MWHYANINRESFHMNQYDIFKPTECIRSVIRVIKRNEWKKSKWACEGSQYTCLRIRPNLKFLVHESRVNRSTGSEARPHIGNSSTRTEI